MNVAVMDVFSRLMMDRIIFLGVPISDDVANIIQAQLLFLDSTDSKSDIQLYINSPGGSVYAGLGIYDTMQLVQSDVATICTGLAASMASVILAAGTPGHRFCTEHSRVMLHEPLLANGIGGSCSSIQEAAKHILERKELINDLLSRFTKRSIEEIETATAYDHFYSAQEAVEFGLVDHVAGSDILMELLGGVTEDDLS